MPLLKVWQSGNSLVITIPADMARTMRIHHGTTVFARQTSSGCITLRPSWIKDTRGDPHYPKRPRKPPS